ncbi:acyltransferase family protein [Stenotrophomonas maltophilia]|uniref:acyltransferase family protein n=1 Tax=Stenotrophomonas maltophilia TaxID=40324 RepID=UPI000C14C61F|nr:acyltransferase [Stenotrophomonas maltophilia]
MNGIESFASIQVLRGIAALAVVLFHLKGFEAAAGASNSLLPSWIRFGYSGVDLFFVISGFVMTVIAAGRYQSPSASLQFLSRRAWRVLPIYWLMSACIAAWSAFWVARNPVTNSAFDTQTLISSFLLWPPGASLIIPVGWTLVHEAYFYLAMAIAICLVPERRLTAYLLGWALLVAIVLTLRLQTTPAMHLASSPLTWDFIAGALIGLHWRRVPARLGLPLLLCGIGMFVCAAIWLNAAGVEHPGELGRVAMFGSASAAVVLGAVNWEAYRRPRLPAWLHSLGDSSYSLYLSHFFIISLCVVLANKLGGAHSWFQHVLFLVGALSLCLIASQVLFKWVEQPLQSFARKLHRRRPQPA